MAFDVTKIKAYVDEQKIPLLKKTIFGAESVKDFAKQLGVKYKDALNILTVSAPLADGSTCGFSASGDDAFTQRILEVKPLKVNKEWCPKALLNYWNGYLVNVGATRQNLPFEEYLTSEVIRNVNEQIEKIAWVGDASLGVKGIIDIASGETEVVDVTLEAAQSAYDKIMAVYNAIPSEVLDKAVIYVGLDMFRSFVQDMVTKNLYHYSAGEGTDVKAEFIIPGTSTRIKAANGLNGTKKIVAVNPEEVYVGTDMLDDSEVYDMWFDQSSRTYRMDIEFNFGVQIAYPNRVVLGAEA